MQICWSIFWYKLLPNIFMLIVIAPNFRGVILLVRFSGVSRKLDPRPESRTFFDPIILTYLKIIGSIWNPIQIIYWAGELSWHYCCPWKRHTIIFCSFRIGIQYDRERVASFKKFLSFDTFLFFKYVILLVHFPSMSHNTRNASFGYAFLLSYFTQRYTIQMRSALLWIS